ncbi:c-type cytochrome biogenesis protein CcmI [Ruegeria sediminis]|uniref:C-type cytochrome biogenesis protein CcmI n=1 Tax=Ruegeria sediminis TaxID=2583820 RepID=A0ABY2WUQ7_9RHOB|nr:c-type cytochrome biogenesis protein CcmI [Ruegeria sediminis]TMV06344.1 c-type cytochrome biogenesis protein CcmI [Ruegeria sediminis]
MTFWILISLMALVIAAVLGLTMLRGRRNGEPAAAYDLRVYREQLAGVDRDLARGVIAEADADRIRTEISRRILAADAQLQQERDGGGPASRTTLGVAAVLGVLLIGGAVLIYQQLGAPGYGDLPLSLRLEMAEEIHAERPDQATAEARMPASPEPEIEENYANLLKQLRETVAGRPDDLQGHMLLAQHEANVGNFKAAYEAKQRVIELSGDSATAEDHAELAELLIIAAGGYVSPEAEEVLDQAIALDPSNGLAAYYRGQMLTQVGRPDLAFRLWDEALRTAPAGAPWADAIRSQIEELAYRAGVDYQLPPSGSAPMAGPSDEDVAAAGDMNAEDRQEMIQGMVDRLADRLATEGGSPEEWSRLIDALGVLGDTERAAAIHDEALAVFAGNPDALDLIGAAAEKAGLTQ